MAATKIIRGQLITFTSTPKDGAGSLIAPSSVDLYVNYKHADGTTSTDTAIPMPIQGDGSYSADFDTKVVLPGKLFASIRTISPAAAADFEFDIKANPANPAP